MAFCTTSARKQGLHHARVHRGLVMRTKSTFLEVATELDFEDLLPFRRQSSDPVLSNRAIADGADFATNNVTDLAAKEHVSFDDPSTTGSIVGEADSSKSHDAQSADEASSESQVQTVMMSAISTVGEADSSKSHDAQSADESSSESHVRNVMMSAISTVGEAESSKPHNASSSESKVRTVTMSTISTVGEAESSKPHDAHSADDSSSEPQVQTVMMRHVPNRYSQHLLLQELHDANFQVGKDIDFFYLPVDRNKGANLGYCFMNFVSASRAAEFAAAFQGKRMKRFKSSKRVAVIPAVVQGYAANQAHYAGCRVARLSDHYKPLFFGPANLSLNANLKDHASPNTPKELN